MKAKIYLSISILSCFLLSSCEDFLDLEPHNFISSEFYFNTPEEVEQGVNGVYHSLQSFTNTSRGFPQYLGDLLSDNTHTFMHPIDRSRGGAIQLEQIDEYRMDAGLGQAQALWNAAYNGIGRANNIMFKIDGVEFTSEELKNQYVGECKFIRAFYFFYLVQCFGDIPLPLSQVEKPEEARELKRRPTSEVYETIIRDLTDAATKLPLSYSEKDDIGRATKGAAQALLGKVYLTLNQYADAQKQLEAVVNSGQYSLLGSYADLWKIENENSTESLFEVQFKSGNLDEGSSFPYFLVPYDGSSELMGAVGISSSGAGISIPTPDLINAYEDGDLRKEASLREYFIKSDGDTSWHAYTTKYLHPSTSGINYDSDANWPILRYADVLLMLAEALNEQGNSGQALLYLNQVRNRAGLADITITDPGELKHIIGKDRRLELAFEGHRWFDLKRTGRAMEVLSRHAKEEKELRVDGGYHPDYDPERYILDEHDLLLPIPGNEINKVPGLLYQNPGY